jgi:hypothetical protein
MLILRAFSSKYVVFVEAEFCGSDNAKLRQGCSNAGKMRRNDFAR